MRVAALVALAATVVGGALAIEAVRRRRLGWGRQLKMIGIRPTA